MVANINLIKQEGYSIVNLEKQLMSNESPKQTLLNQFSLCLKMEGEEQLCDCVNELKLGLSSNNEYGLFKNRETSLWKRKVPESAALAMTGTVYKLFGSRLLNARNQLDKNLLEMAMQMVYGKDMVTKSGDILIDIQLNKDGSLQSKHYTFDVGEVINSYNIDLFVNASSINQTYLHDKNPGDVISLYGTLDNVPLVVKECTGKNHQINVKAKLPQERSEKVEDMCERMRGGISMFNHNTKTAGNIEHNLRLSFLVDSRPSITNKYSVKDVGPDILALPVNVYRADFKIKINNEVEKASSIVLCAVQKNLHAARKVLSGIIGNVPKNNKPKTIIFDLRFLSAIKKKVFLGSEKPLFVKHTAMMREACKELPQSVEYVPLACEAHSHRSVALAKTVAAPIMATGVGSALMYATSSGPYYAQSLSGSPDIEMIKNRMAQLFTQLDASVRNKYRPAFDKWNELVDKLNHERNTVPFACLTTILSTAINETPEGDTNVAVVMGCKSAKDRTISIVLGNSMLQTLFEKRLADDGEIENLFDQQGYFNCDSLTAKELMMLKDLFDIRVLHLSNKFNVGLQGNINTDVLQDSFFKNVDFIHESSSYTVGMGV
ncbi:TPA: hypothetical protein KL475_003286 [Escherichia coli]|nr:hypothetical protein [Escherichia coli]